MKTLRKKVLSALLALAMVAGLLQPMALEAAEATNVALGKTPTVAFVDGSEMTTGSNGHTDMSTIAYATDGSYDNKNAHFRYAEGSERKASYLQIDLEAVCDISEIKMWRYYDGRNYDPTVIAVSDSDADWSGATVVYSSDDDNVYGFGTEVTESAGYVEEAGGKTISCTATGRYVRLYAMGATLSNGSTNNGNHLVEFQVWGVPHVESVEPDEPEESEVPVKLPVEKIRTINASSVTETNEGENLTSIRSDKLKELVYDGSNTTFWRSAQGAKDSIQAGNPYLEFKLDGIYKLTKLEYTPRNANGSWRATGNIKNLIVQISADGSEWITVNGDGTSVSLDGSQTMPVAVEFDSTEALAVRVSGTASYHWKTDGSLDNSSICVADIALYGSYVKAAPVDKSELNAAIAEAESLRGSSYTTDTWAELQAALNAAKAVGEDADQSAIDSAANGLKTAIKNLVELKPMQNAETPLTVPTFEAPGKRNGEAVHPDIVDMSNYPNVCDEDGKWHGYRYYMATTPNQNGNSQFENPCLVASNDGINWETPAGITNPLTNVPQEPTPYHNCDADLVYNDDTDELYLYYIWSDDSTSSATNGKSSQLRLFEIAWDEEKGELYSVSGFTPIVSIAKTDKTYSVLSPSIVKEGNVWKMWCVNTDSFQSGYRSQSNHVDYRVSNDGIHWSAPLNLAATFDQDRYIPWHIDVAKIGSEYWAVFPAYRDGRDSGYTDLFYAKSSDGLVWTTYAKPLLTPDTTSWDNAFIYRGTFLYDDDNDVFRLWYSGGASSSYGWRIGYTENDYSDMVTLLGNASAATGAAETVPTAPTVAAANKAALTNAITSANTLNQANYTADSWAVFARGLALANEMKDNANATQEEVDALVIELTRVRAALAESDPEPDEWTIIDNADARVTYSGTWVTNNESQAHAGTNKIANDPSAYAEFTFTGTALRWYGQKDSNFGTGKIYVDGSYCAYANAGDAVGYKKLYAEVTGLANTEHTVRFYPEGPAANEQNWVELDYIEVSASEAYASVQPNALEMSVDSVRLKVGGTKTVALFAKNGTSFVGGTYEVAVDDENIAGATLNGNEVTITGVAKGTTTVVVSMGNFRDEITVTVKEPYAGGKKLVVDNEHPLLIIPVYGRVYDPNGSTLDWGDTLVGRWNSVPDDLKPYAVLELHVGGVIGCKDSYRNSNTVCKEFYEQQLAIAEENDIPIMLMVATAGQNRVWTSTADLDNTWLEWVIQEYDCVKGFFITENYWTTWDRVATLAADYMRIAAENGGYVIWSEHHTNVLQGIMNNTTFTDALKLYGSNFAFTWKNTPAGSRQNAGSAATIQGLWLNGNIDQWGGLADTWKWWELGLWKLFDQGRAPYSGDGQGEEARTIVMEPEAMLGMEMLSIYANGGTIYNFEHPAYVYGSYDETSPAFSNVVAETLRWIIKHPTPTKKEILEDTKVILHGNVPNSFFTGLTSDNQSSPTYKTGRYGLAPYIPASVAVNSAIADKVQEYSSVTGSANEFYNRYYTSEYEGTAFAQKAGNTWILYNNLFNQQGSQNATVFAGNQSVKVDMTEHTFTLIEKADNSIKVHLNNYRVNKDSVWEGVVAETENWNTDVNTLLQEWIRDWYCNDNTRADGGDTYRTTVYTLTGLTSAPTVEVTRVLNDSAKTPVVAYKDGTATITVENNGYMDFTIVLNGVGVTLDKSVLNTEITKAEALKKEDYTAESWAAADLVNAIAAAKNVMDTADSQKTIDNAVKDLRDAVAKLVRAVNKTALKASIQNAESKVKDKDKYTSASFNALEAALKKAKVVFSDANATQTQVDNATLALKNAIAGLVPSGPTEIVIPSDKGNNKGGSTSSTGKASTATTPTATTPTSTGDSAEITLMISLLGISALAIVGIFFRKRKA